MSEAAQPSQSDLGRSWTLGVAAAGATGVALALMVVRIGVGETAASRAYVEQPEFAVFGGLVLLQIPVWAVLGVVSARWAAEIRALPPTDDTPLWQVLLAWIGAAVVVGFLLWAQGTAMAVDYERQYPDGQPARIVVMASVVAFAAAVPAVALWELSRAAAAIRPSADDAVERFAQLWSRQRDFLGALGLMLALVMLSTAAKFAANNSFTPPDSPEPPDVPASFILVIGALYGAILLAAYLPPYYRTRRVGERLAKALTGPPADRSSEALLATHEERQRLRVAMGLDEGTRQHLERGAILLAPLLTALITTLVPGVQG